MSLRILLKHRNALYGLLENVGLWTFLVIPILAVVWSVFSVKMVNWMMSNCER